MTRLPIVIVAVVTAALTLAPATAGEPQTAAPTDAVEAAGTKLITTLCGSCHARGSAVGTHRTKQDWEEVLEWMIDEGAVMSDDEFEEVLKYLSVRYGRVAINTAPVDEIRHVLELTEGQAQHLVEARTDGRRFGTLKDVADTAGVPEAFLEARKARIAFE